MLLARWQRGLDSVAYLKLTYPWGNARLLAESDVYNCHVGDKNIV